MSNAFTAAAQALNDDADLRSRVVAATSAEERAEILRAAGVPVPTRDEVPAEFAGVVGAGVTTDAENAGSAYLQASKEELKDIIAEELAAAAAG